MPLPQPPNVQQPPGMVYQARVNIRSSSLKKFGARFGKDGCIVSIAKPSHAGFDKVCAQDAAGCSKGAFTLPVPSSSSRSSSSSCSGFKRLELLLPALLVRSSKNGVPDIINPCEGAGGAAVAQWTAQGQLPGRALSGFKVRVLAELQPRPFIGHAADAIAISPSARGLISAAQTSIAAA